MRKTFAKFILGALAAGVVQMQAAVIASNLADATNGSGTIYASGPPQDYAQEFSTGNSSVTLGNVIAVLGTSTGSYTAGANLLNSASGAPGSTVLTTFTVPAIGSTAGNDAFTPNSSVTLAANTDYWFELTAAGTGDYKWSYTDSTTALPTNAAIGNYAVSHNGTTWTVETNGPFLLEVDSAAITTASAPEPSSFLLVGLIGLGLVAVRRSF